MKLRHRPRRRRHAVARSPEAQVTTAPVTERQNPEALARTGTRLLIVGVALSITAVLSDTALAVQLVAYEPSCEPFVAWSFAGACGVLRLLIMLMLPFLVVGSVLIALGIAQRLRHHRAA
jgi:hypothetical protein